MADDPKKAKQDRKLVAGRQPYEVAYFAKKHGITRALARSIINVHGPSRRKCDAAAHAHVDVGALVAQLDADPDAHATKDSPRFDNADDLIAHLKAND